MVQTWQKKDGGLLHFIKKSNTQAPTEAECTLRFVPIASKINSMPYDEKNNIYI